MREFLFDDGGAVTVDWVVLTAALVGLGLAVTAVVSGGVQTASSATAAKVGGIGIATTFDGIRANAGMGHAPNDPDFYDSVTTGLSGLSDADLALADAILTDLYVAPSADLDDPQLVALAEDIEGGLAEVMGERGLSRNPGGAYTDADVDRINDALGGGAASVSADG